MLGLGGIPPIAFGGRGPPIELGGIFIELEGIPPMGLGGIPLIELGGIPMELGGIPPIELGGIAAGGRMPGLGGPG